MYELEKETDEKIERKKIEREREREREKSFESG